MDGLMNVVGIGVISANGRGINSHKESLSRGWVPPSGKLAYCVSAESLNDKLVLKEMRRADRFSKMAALAAWDAVQDSGIDLDELKSSLGIIVATAFGAHATTFRFLDDILDYGDDNVSPTAFSNSVHNAAGSYIASILGNQGPVLTMTQLVASFHQALILAESWIKEGRCRNVLVGSVDEYADVMEYICSRKLTIAEDGKIRPFLFTKMPASVPGEGSSFFLVTDQNSPKKYASISALYDDNVQEPDMLILDCDGMVGSEEGYRAIGQTKSLISSYVPIFGSMLTISSFNCAAAALMIKEQYYYAAPVQDNPHGLNLCKAHQPAAISSISCLRYGCKGERLQIFLKQ